METLTEYWPLLVPIIIIEFVLMLTALIHVLRHDHYKFGKKPVWILIVVCIQMIGPIVYFVFGREEE